MSLLELNGPTINNGHWVREKVSNIKGKEKDINLRRRQKQSFADDSQNRCS